MTPLTRLKTAVKRAGVELKQELHRRRLAERSRLRRGRLHESYWSADVDGQGHLCLGGLDAIELAERHGTPLHVISEERLRSDYRSFIEPFRDRYSEVRLATSYKTNPLPGVLRKLHEYGTMAEVISHFELWLALRLGLDPDDIIFNGPGKTLSALELAVKERIGLINVDGLEEIRELERVAARLGARDVPVGVRLTTSVGWQSQFGLAIHGGLAERAFRLLESSDRLAPTGIHLHLGTGIEDVEAYRRAVGEAISFARSMERSHSIRIDVYDFGGGFGVPTVSEKDVWDRRAEALGYPSRSPIPEETPPPEEYATVILGELHDLAGEAMSRERLKVVLEPGRAITSASQILLLSVLRRKQTGEGADPILIVDGGKNIAIPLGYEKHEIFPAGAMDAECSEQYDVYGPLCHPHDVVRRNLQLPPIGRGDVIAVMDAGAYFIPNQMNFSHPRPAVVMVEKGEAEISREREEFEDVVANDRWPEGNR